MKAEPRVTHSRQEVAHSYQEDSEEETSTPILSFRAQLLRDRLHQKTENERKDTAYTDNTETQDDGRETEEPEDNHPLNDHQAVGQDINWRLGSYKGDSESTEIITVDDYIAKMGLNYSFLQPEETNPQPSRHHKDQKMSSRLIAPKPKDQPVFAQHSKNPDGLIRRTTNIMEALPDKVSCKKRRRSPLIKTLIEDTEENFPSLG